MKVRDLGRRLLIFLVVLAFIAGAAFLGLRYVSRWLVVNDPPQKARAIVVLSGLIPYRAMEAAEIYKQGWAPEVWLFKDDPRGADEAFANMGIHHVSEQEYDQQVLEHLGVPRNAIRVLDPPATNTRNEFSLLQDELSREGGDKVILVTSPVHTRRAKIIWHMVVKDHPQAILRYDAYEAGDPAHWWRSTRDTQDVEHELLGIVDAYLGFIVNPPKK